MNNKKRYSPWLWIPSLSSAEEIPSAIVTFVALLMFVQFGEGWGMSSLYAALLSLPWVMKSFVRSKVRSMGYFKLHIHVAECLIFLMMMLTEMSINHWRTGNVVLFLIFFVISCLTAWHELLSRMYYERMLYPREQVLYNKTKIFSTQVTMVLTYGVLIIIAGLLQVFFRNIYKAWAMESYIVAGVFFLYVITNFIVLQNPRIHNPYRYESMARAVKTELHIIDRIQKKTHSRRVLLSLFFLLLPQALMFNTRVFFLMAKAEEGGLECTIQDVGFAQGTIGVIAFSLGIVLGRNLLHRFHRKVFWHMAVCLTLSPVCYLVMSQHPLEGDMLALCVMTFTAQILFGFGLNVCMYFVRFISNERYRNTINYLYIPLIAGSMLLPMALSGWLCEWLGFRTYFIVNAATAVIAWLLLPLLKIKQILTNDLQK